MINLPGKGSKSTISVMEAGDYLALIENDSAFTSRFPDVKNYIGATGFGLSASGECIKLVNDEGQIIDSLTYDDSIPWPVEADGSGVTLELRDTASDNSNAEYWKAAKGHGTPGKANSVVTGIEESELEVMPDKFSLFQNYPNPFNPVTTIRYSVSRDCYVSLQVYDLLGREVATLFKGTRQAGNYTVNFDCRGLSSGVYFYQMKLDNFIGTRKFVLIK